MLARLSRIACSIALLIGLLPPDRIWASSHVSHVTYYASPLRVTRYFSRSPQPLTLSTPDDLPAICPAFYHLQNPMDCPDMGPGGYAEDIVAAGLPYPLPRLEITPLYPYRSLTPDAYARVITDSAPTYRHPSEALAGLPPLRTWEKGFVFVSVLGTTTIQGQDFYEINSGEFMHAGDMEEALPSTFSGTFFASPPNNPVGWIITHVQPSTVPGQPPDPNAAWAGRYQEIQVYGVQRVGEWSWYLIGPGQWVEQRMVALVQPAPPPGMGGDVIAVDTYEQSLGVYRGGQLVFATLVSSGSRYFPTPPGTFSVWAKFTHGRMTGAYFDDRRDYYFLEDVPWILYYDGDRALHGAYWHDNFGIRASHGCVNLSPRDSRWLFDFVGIGAAVVVFSSQ